MEKFKYIIIDDDRLLHLSVQQQLNAYQNYECMAAFDNPINALSFLQEHDVDLICLDIEMPKMNGFQFLEALKKKIFVVILTAYPEKYSFEAHLYYDKDLVFFSNKAQFSYYLPKIITRFEKMYAEKEQLNRIYQLSKNEILTFPKITKNKQPIPLADIVYIMVIGHNIILKMKDGEEVICRMSIRELLEFLPPNIFSQIRRNIIVNVGYIFSFTESTVCIENQCFTISKQNRRMVAQTIREARNLLYTTMD
jgi:DNA-binding LytR/AlgR family response regulator